MKYLAMIFNKEWVQVVLVLLLFWMLVTSNGCTSSKIITTDTSEPNLFPAEFANLTPTISSGMMSISFTSTNESGYFIYIIEKSTDQKNWVNVISFKPNGKASTYSKSWKDSGAGYYRVKIFLNTGAFVTSKIIYVR